MNTNKKKKLKIVCLSDTHNRTLDHDVPDGDILIHAGDATDSGSITEIEKFAEWFGAFPHKHKIFVAGNHDFWYERYPRKANSIYPSLHDESIEIQGLKIYGSSWQPEFHNWAFNLTRGFRLKRKWARIPDDTDILITHTPPMFVLDINARGSSVGCADLYQRVREIKPRLHVFGHIHESYGKVELGGTTFVNAAICDRAYKAVNKPIVVEIERPVQPAYVNPEWFKI